MALLTEYHCHILPGIDDGSDSAETSLHMIEMMKKQGVERICATPHFYAHREKSVAEYLKKRQAAFEQIQGQTAVTDIHLGAEVAIEHGISELPDIEKLAIQGTRIILLELPYRPYEKWMSEEIYNIAAEFKLKVMLAHVHRYLPYYSKEELEAILHCTAMQSIRSTMKLLQAGRKRDSPKRSWQSIRIFRLVLMRIIHHHANQTGICCKRR